MLTTNEILHLDNFDDLSRLELLEIIKILCNDLKYLKYRKDSGQEQLNTLVGSLRAQIEFDKKESTRLKQVNTNFRNKIIQPLTIMERIKGRIDLKN